MRTVECAREQDVVDALTTGRWPERCDGGLRTHVQTCESCGDVVTIFLPLRDAWESTSDSLQVPSSGIVWWRAQMRARQEAAQAAAAPITVAQSLTAVAALVGGIAVLVAMFPWLTASIGDASSSAADMLAPLAAIGDASGPWLMTVLILGAGMLITPVAVYFAIPRD